jgi:hypothetical protein
MNPNGKVPLDGSSLRCALLRSNNTPSTDGCNALRKAASHKIRVAGMAASHVAASSKGRRQIRPA